MPYKVFWGPVAVVDILGFKYHLKAQSPSWVLDKIVLPTRELLLKSVEHHNQSSREDDEENKDYGYDSFHTDLELMFYADTFVVYSPVNTCRYPRSIFPDFELSRIAADMIASSLRNGIYIRGAISYGEYAVDRTRTVIAGKCIAEAHDREKAQEWIGISYCGDYPFYQPKEPLERYEIKDLHTRPYFDFPRPKLISYEVPTKTNTPLSAELHWTIDWWKDCLDARDHLGNACSNTKNDHLKTIIENTLMYGDSVDLIEERNIYPNQAL